MAYIPKWKNVFKAAERKDLEAVKYFVQKEEDTLRSTDEKGRTVALIAASLNDIPVLKYALETDDSVLLESNYYGWNIIQYAIDNGALDTVKYLVEHHKWDIHHKNKPSLGNTPIHEAAKRNKFEILKYLIEEKKGDSNIRNDFGDTPLFLAAEKPFMKIIRYLVDECNASLKVVNDFNENILFVAVKNKHLNVMQYVLEEKQIRLDINWTDKSHRTLLFWAVKKDVPRIIKYLVEKKNADVNIADDEKRTALHLAAFDDNYPTCKYLVEHKANLYAKDYYGYIPADNANDDNLTNYFNELTPLKRVARSIIPSVTFEEHQKPSKRISEHSSGLENGRAEVHFTSNEFNGFVAVIDTLTRYVREASSRRRIDHQGVLSSRHMVLDKIDPIAVEATKSAPK